MRSFSPGATPAHISRNRSHVAIDRGAEVAQASGVRQENQAADRAPLPTDWEQHTLPLQGPRARKGVANFSAGAVSSAGGVLLLRELHAYATTRDEVTRQITTDLLQFRR